LVAHLSLVLMVTATCYRIFALLLEGQTIDSAATQAANELYPFVSGTGAPPEWLP